jgi:outer membrane protein assembly factor BamB
MVIATSSDTPQPLPSTVRWSVVLAAPPAAPPVLGRAHVFVALKSGMVAAHRIADGSEAWHVELRTDLPVAVEGARVFVAAGDAIQALNADDRTVLWRAPAGALTAPLLVHEGWVLAASKGQLAAYRSADGSLVWRQASGVQRERATIEGDNLYIPLEDGRLLALALDTGRTRWAQQLDGAPTEILAFADRIYVGSADKWFYSFSAATGEVSWKFRVGAALRGRPAADSTRVYAAAIDNVVRAFDRVSGALRWHPSVPFRPSAGPTVIGSTVVVPGTSLEIRAFRAATGSPAGTITVPDPLATAPAFGVADGVPAMAAVTGGLANQWKLLFSEGSMQGPIAPITVLPGTVVPLPAPPPKR